MKHERKKLSSGQVADIFDDVFDYNATVRFALFFQKSYFIIGGKATTLLEQVGYSPNFNSPYSIDDVNNLGIFNHPSSDPMNKIIDGREFHKAWVNCFTPCSVTCYHYDLSKKESGKTFLYYGNTEWNKNQGGETLLYNDNLDPEIIIEYKPNRVVVYDSDIPHKPLQHLQSSTPYRFSFVAVFKRTHE